MAEDPAGNAGLRINQHNLDPSRFMVAYTYEKCPREANKGIWLERENNGERDRRSAVPTKKKFFKLSFALEPPVERDKHFRLGRVGFVAHA